MFSVSFVIPFISPNLMNFINCLFACCINMKTTPLTVCSQYSIVLQQCTMSTIEIMLKDFLNILVQLLFTIKLKNIYSSIIKGFHNFSCQIDFQIVQTLLNFDVKLLMTFSNQSTLFTNTVTFRRIQWKMNKRLSLIISMKLV